MPVKHAGEPLAKRWLSGGAWHRLWADGAGQEARLGAACVHCWRAEGHTGSLQARHPIPLKANIPNVAYTVRYDTGFWAGCSTHNLTLIADKMQLKSYVHCTMAVGQESCCRAHKAPSLHYDALRLGLCTEKYRQHFRTMLRPAGKHPDGMCHPLYRPVRKEEEQVVKDLMGSLHDAFKDTVRSARGAKISAASEAELWSGRMWTGAQAAKLGLVDGTGTLNSVMRSKFGDQVRCLLQPPL